jgi:hypothetical protein
MVWSNLPPDVEEVILGLLSLVALARISRTCHSFHASFSRRMAELQKTRCDLAVSWFGPKRITCIAGLVTSFVNGKPMGENLSKIENDVCNYQISLDGVLHLKDRVTCNAMQPYPKPSAIEAGDCRVMWSSSMHYMSIHVHTAGGGHVSIKVGGQSHWVTFVVMPCVAEDFLPVALIQALLSQDLAPTFCDAVSHLEVAIEGCFSQETWVPYTHDALQAQILPIRPLINGALGRVPRIMKTPGKNWSLGYWGSPKPFTLC